MDFTNIPRESEIGNRDAVHAPVICVTSWHNLAAGQPVKFDDDSLTTVVACDREDMQAIVNPFLEGYTNYLPFWVLLVPNSTNGLRHVYEVDFKSNNFMRISSSCIHCGSPHCENNHCQDSCRGCY